MLSTTQCYREKLLLAAGKRSPVLLKALPLGNKLVVSWLALGRPAQPQVLELEEARFVAEDPSSCAPSRTACPVHRATVQGCPDRLSGLPGA